MSLFIYLLGVVDGIISAVTFILIMGVILAIPLFINLLISIDDKKDNVTLLKKWFYRTAAVVIMSSVTLILTPSSKTLAAMYLVPKIAENKTMQNLPKKLEKIVNLKLDDWIDDLGGER